MRSCPGRSFSRSRSSLGMTTWNFGDTFTVCMFLSCNYLIDRIYVCQYLYRCLRRNTAIPSAHVFEVNRSFLEPAATLLRSPSPVFVLSYSSSATHMGA